ncbi:MAG TPA: molybdopterin-dependent oxidoreductase [Streptosporangiaceae bacterium]|nr:molybdopterin-dependent oxidoreductase [Streptosporangiaceae bacterium]
MGIVSPGFSGRRRGASEQLPPGQYLVTDFPVLSAGPTPRVDTGSWELRISSPDGPAHTWDWTAFRALPSEEFTVDLHCVTKWSKLRTRWRGVSLDTLAAAGLTFAGPASAGWPPGTAPAVFACGPTGFVEAAANLLVDAGHDPRSIKTERLGPSGG